MLDHFTKNYCIIIGDLWNTELDTLRFVKVDSPTEGLTKKYSDLFFDPDQVLVDNLKVFPDVVLAGLPGQAKDNQVVSLVGVVVVVILVVNLKKILIGAIQPCSILLQYIF